MALITNLANKLLRHSLLRPLIQQKQAPLQQLLKQHRFFSTSPRRHVIPPLVWLIAKPLTKLSAIIVGRGFRQWWQSLPKNKRDILKMHLIRNRIRYLLITSSTVGGSVYYYQSHLQDAPITHRRRFILFSSDQLKEIENLEKDQVTVEIFFVI